MNYSKEADTACRGGEGGVKNDNARGQMQAAALRELRDPLRDTWARASWSRSNGALGLVRLLQLWDSRFVPVEVARRGAERINKDYEIKLGI